MMKSCAKRQYGRTLLSATLCGLSLEVAADCVITGSTATCDANPPNPFTSGLDLGAVNGASVTLDGGASAESAAQLQVGDAIAISTGTGATIAVGSNAIVRNLAVDQDNDLIQIGGDTLVRIEAGAMLLAEGNNPNTEAIQTRGANNTIVNAGVINAQNARAVNFVAAGQQVLINRGVIIGQQQAVLSQGQSDVTIINSGVIQGDSGTAILWRDSGGNTLVLEEGSDIRGIVRGVGSNTLVLGAGAAATFDLGLIGPSGQYQGFDAFRVQDNGTWSLIGSATQDLEWQVESGTLRFAISTLGLVRLNATGGRFAYANDVTVPSPIELNTTIPFLTEGGTATQSGIVSGPGALLKVGTGSLILSGNNSYSGGTGLNSGTLVVAEDANLGAASGPLDFSGGTLQTTQSFASGRTFSVSAGGATIDTAPGTTLTLGGTSSGTGGLNKIGAGVLRLDGDNAYTGETRVQSGTLSLNGMLLSPTLVESAGTLSGNGTLLASLGNAGTVAPGNSIGVLTVAGDYVGNGGLLAIESVLGDDSSPSDRLVVQGNSSGSTRLEVTNLGGKGAVTRGDGIRVVQVDGNSAGTFALQKRVVAGAFDYRLFQGGGSDPNDGDWYLRSAPPPAPPAPTPPGPTPSPTPGPGPQPAPQPQPTPRPFFRPEIGAYLGNQFVALRMFNRLTLHDRLGEIDFSERQRDSENGAAVWVRTQGSELEASSAHGVLDMDSHIDLLQVGAELLRWSEGDDRFHLGLMASQGRARTDSDNDSSGFGAKGEVDGTGVGIYATWFRSASQASGLYLDSWLQYGRHDNEIQGDGLPREHYDSHTWALSLEAGYAMEMLRGAGMAYFLEPQAQVIHSQFDSERLTEANGTQLDANDVEGLTGRLGLRLYARSLDSGAPRIQPFVQLDWWHEDDDNEVELNDDRFQRSSSSNHYGIKLGVQAELQDNWSGWAQLGALEGENDTSSLSGEIGLRYAF
ncbi:outer membrane autotransporter barrel domain protein [compost metagenome]